jgi:hypothetical protein
MKVIIARILSAFVRAQVRRSIVVPRRYATMSYASKSGSRITSAKRA